MAASDGYCKGYGSQRYDDRGYETANDEEGHGLLSQSSRQPQAVRCTRRRRGREEELLGHRRTENIVSAGNVGDDADA